LYAASQSVNDLGQLYVDLEMADQTLPKSPRYPVPGRSGVGLTEKSGQWQQIQVKATE